MARLGIIVVPRLIIIAIVFAIITAIADDNNKNNGTNGVDRKRSSTAAGSIIFAPINNHQHHHQSDSIRRRRTATSGRNGRNIEVTQEEVVIRHNISRYDIMNSTKKFSFVHISKCAGVSWIRYLKEMLGPERIYPQYETGEEFGFWYQQHKYTDATYNLVSLKSPRHHVWSMFTECKYAPWGRKVTNGTSFPRSNNKTSESDNDIVDFNIWLDYFLYNNNSVHQYGGDNNNNGNNDTILQMPSSAKQQQLQLQQKQDYNCYHPANFQSRYMSTKKQYSTPHHVFDLPASEDPFVPNINIAINNYWKEDWVGLTEFFHESKCLLLYRLSVGNDDIPGGRQYVEEECRCPKSSPSESKDIHVRHHVEGHRSSMIDLPVDTLSKIERITIIDMHLYKVALIQFIKEIIWLESESALDRRVLCQSTIESIEPELLYLNISLSEIYNLSKTSNDNNINNNDEEDE